MDSNKRIKQILQKDNLSKNDIVQLLESDVTGRNILYEKSALIKEKTVGNKVYYRGLIEFSNICSKDCYYCGIRKSNLKTSRFFLTEEEILSSVQFAIDNDYASIVLQSGERNDAKFVDFVDNILQKISRITPQELGITLSVGEQTQETYHRWFKSGANRFLLRIESSNKDLYKKLHPDNSKHDYNTRLNDLYLLQKIGYQTGTGVMIGLPFQTTEDLADDLLFFKSFDIDMVGMGPYIEHEETPLWKYKDKLLTLEDRFNLSLKMVAILRLLMPDINIAATTALQTIDPIGREKAIKIGANVIMPNITPGKYRSDYLLYQNKPCTEEEAVDCANCLEARIHMTGNKIGYGETGDSIHYHKRQDKH